MGLTFHRTFSLSRSSIAKVINLVQGDGGLKREDLATKTDLGTVYQEAMPRYAIRAGLLTPNSKLTDLGEHVIRHDPALSQVSTQWLLHYHLAAPHGATAFWCHLVRKRFLPGNTFSTEDLMADLSDFLAKAASTLPSPRSVRSTVTVFTGTYLKADGLGQLGLLEETSPSVYTVSSPASPGIWVIAYALADYWEAHFGQRLTVNLDDLSQGDLAAIFLLGEERLTQLLLQLKQEGMLDLYRTSRPYQVVLLQPGPQHALQRLQAG